MLAWFMLPFCVCYKFYGILGWHMPRNYVAPGDFNQWFIIYFCLSAFILNVMIMKPVKAVSIILQDVNSNGVNMTKHCHGKG